MNQTCLTGRLTKEVALKKVGANQTSVVEFTLAVKRGFKNKEGKYEADFIRCQAWNETAEFLHKYATKGTMLEITGAIRTNSYKDQNGQTVFTTNVVAEKASITKDGKGKTDEDIDDATPEIPDIAEVTEDIAEDVATTDIGADDLPF